MSAKITTVKTTTASPAKKVPTARMPVTKKGPAVTAATKLPKAAVAQEKKVKKIKNPGSKIKVVRDSFSMPQGDYAKIGELKELCLKEGARVKKNQLLRAGLHALLKLSPAQLKAALSSLDKASAKEADSSK